MSNKSSMRSLRWFPTFLILATILLPAVLGAAVWLSAITGTCTDEDGKPLAGGVLRFSDPANGKHFEVTTSAEGRFTYIAVEPSHYRIDVLRSKHQTKTFLDVYLEWSSRPLLLEIDLRNHSAKVTRQVMIAESFGTEPPPPAMLVPEKDDADAARAINDKIAAVQAYMAVGDWDNALSAAKSATEIDPNRDLPWAWLANVHCSEALHSSPLSKTTVQNCIHYYERAISIAPNPTYFNNVGVAYSSLQQWDKAAENFHAAIMATPENTALYRANLGAALMKQSEVSDKAQTIQALRSAEQEFFAGGGRHSGSQRGLLLERSVRASAGSPGSSRFYLLNGRRVFFSLPAAFATRQLRTRGAGHGGGA